MKAEQEEKRKLKEDEFQTHRQFLDNWREQHGYPKFEDSIYFCIENYEQSLKNKGDENVKKP